MLSFTQSQFIFLTLHRENQSWYFNSLAGATSFPTVRPAVSAWRGTAYSWRFLPWYSTFLPRSATLARDNALTRKPSVHAESGGKVQRRSFVPVRGASDRARG